MSPEVKAAFVAKYGKTSYQVVKAIFANWSTARICSRYNVSYGSVAAWRANVTRGTYYGITEQY
jgi:hypothetical protein